MASSHDEQRRPLREAGRKYAAMRQVINLRCAVCGNETSGMKTKRYCSDVCRVRAARNRANDEQGRRAGVSARLSRAIAEFDRIRENFSQGAKLEDSVELIRREREVRTEDLMRAARGDHDATE